MPETVPPEGDIVVREPEPLPRLLDTLGEREIHARIDKALSMPGATVGIGDNNYTTFIGSSLICSYLGVSVSTRVESRIAADVDIEYVATARVLGPFGQMVEAQAVMAMADAAARKGPKLDRGQCANLAQTRAYNRVTKMAFAPFVFAPRPNGGKAPAVNTMDDMPGDGMNAELRATNSMPRRRCSPSRRCRRARTARR